MTAQNFKNVDKAVNKKGKAKEINMESPEQPLASTSSAPLVTRISSPVEEPLIWCTDEEMFDVAPPKTVEDAMKRILTTSMNPMTVMDARHRLVLASMVGEIC